MVKVVFIAHSGEQREVDADVGLTVMEAAVHNDTPGILAECGGCCSCATCHVYVAEPWLAKVGPPGDMEKELLELTPEPRANSRLSCQIKITDELDGLTVQTPESQV